MKHLMRGGGGVKKVPKSSDVIYGRPPKYILNHCCMVSHPVKVPMKFFPFISKAISAYYALFRGGGNGGAGGAIAPPTFVNLVLIYP